MTVSNQRMHVILNDSFIPPREFNDTTIRFGTPVVVDQHDRNTRVTIYGRPGKGYYGEVDVYYNRVDIQELTERFRFRTNVAFTRESIAQAYINWIQEDLTIDDFDEFSQVDLEPSEVLETEIAISPESLQWYGTLPLTLENGLPELDTAIGRRSLGLFVHPNPEYRKRYGRILGWNVDFTGALDIIGPDEHGEYIDWNAVRVLCSGLSWPMWNKGRLTDLPTSQVPEANPAFERVIVQSGGTSGSMRTPIYFHYNPVRGYR